MKILGLLLLLLIPFPVFAQEMGFYHNKQYDFSFEIPMTWYYQEGITMQETTFEVIQYPQEFSLENAGDDANLLDMEMALGGMGFQIESPMIHVNFENLPKSKVQTLNENFLEEYVLETIRIELPDAKIIDSWSNSYSWGWEVYVMYSFNLNFGIGSGIPYVAEEFTYVFKDRESYNVGYGSPDSYFEEYRWVFDHVLETIVIKSVAVPEFQEITLMVLASSIILVVIMAKKFGSRFMNT